jgi:hypothetical protein
LKAVGEKAAEVERKAVATRLMSFIVLFDKREIVDVVNSKGVEGKRGHRQRRYPRKIAEKPLTREFFLVSTICDVFYIEPADTNPNSVGGLNRIFSGVKG